MSVHIQVDVAVLGAGFGGSLTSLLLERIGLRPVLLEGGSHPRFAIGESSTPSADLVLRDLATRYELPRLQPLSSYGSWRATYPGLVRGLKRGFSYFHQLPGRDFVPRHDHQNELLVAASSDECHSDTHWLRSDFDTFLAMELEATGIPYYDRTQVSIEAQRPVWQLKGEREGKSLRIEAPFLIDATGEGRFLPRALGLRTEKDGLRTHSRALYAHFAGVKPWHDLLVDRGGRVEDHPFSCDSAALHHLLEDGWMWQLRFDNGVVSAGFALDATHRPLRREVPIEEEWNTLLKKYPALAEQFAEARLVQPEGGLQRTGRLQRRVERIVGENWALLPHTAGFIDPLHSTGIAHTLCGIERLMAILERHWNRDSLPDALRRYETTVQQEFDLIDKLVHGNYLALDDFDLFVSFSMLYFAAATTYEHRRLAGRSPAGAAFLCADDPRFCQVVDAVREQLIEGVDMSDRENMATRFRDSVARAIAPFNLVGLCDPTVANMYRHTALPYPE